MQWCQKGTGTPESVCVYPALIYHEEDIKPFPLIPYQHFSLDVQGEGNMTTWNYSATPPVEINASIPDWLFNFMFPRILLNQNINITPNATYIINFSLSGKSSVYANIHNFTIYYPPFLVPENSTFFIVNQTLYPGQTLYFQVTFKSLVEAPFDADSLIHFLQDYQPSEIKLVGDSPVPLDNLLITPAPIGAGLNPLQITRINISDVFSRWENFEELVYVEDNYETAMIASTYASLINAPLVVKSSQLDSPNVFIDRNVICIGNVSLLVGECTESYNLNQLNSKTAQITHSDKLMIANPEDFNKKISSLFSPDKSGTPISELYSKNSLTAPYLASAKHEILVPVTSENVNEIKTIVKDSVTQFMPEIINNPSGILDNNFGNPTTSIVKENVGNGSKKIIYKNVMSYNPDMIPFGDKIAWRKSNKAFFVYDIYNSELKTVSPTTYTPSYLSSFNIEENKLVSNIFEWGGVNNNQIRCKLKLTNLNNSGPSIFIFLGVEDSCYYSDNSFDITGNYIYFTKTAIGGYFRNYTIMKYSIDTYSTQEIFESSSHNVQNIRTLFADDNLLFILAYTNSGIGIFMFNMTDNSTRIITTTANYIQDMFYDSGEIIWSQSNDYGNSFSLYVYDIFTNQTTLITDSLKIGYGNSIVSSPKSLNNMVTYVVDNETVNKQCELTELSCSASSPCSKYCSNTYTTCNSDSDCGNNGYCTNDPCTPTDYYAYNISSHQSSLVSSGKIITSPLFDGNHLYYGENKRDTYYIDGYLTVIGSHISIPYKEDMDPGSMYDNFKYLDASDYADINNDLHPDMAVGRIQGITSTDVSSYIARDIFLSHSLRSASTKMFASSFDYMIRSAKNWTQSFNNSGYNATCNILPTETSGTDSNCQIDDINNYYFYWPDEYKNKGLVQYLDHGASNWAGINSKDIPYLSNTLLFNDACSTCSTYDSGSFCSNAIRRGALLHAGAASVAYTGNNEYMNMINDIYYNNFTLGQAFSKSFEYNYIRYMTMILGDPTLNINAQPKLISPLEYQW